MFPSATTPCTWRQSPQDQDDHVERTLSVTGQLYGPTTISGIDAARRGFEKPRGWEDAGSAVPVRGLGDEAKLVRRFVPGVVHRRVMVAVRLRNTLTLVDVREESLLDRYRARVPSFDVIETAPVPAYLPGETRAATGETGTQIATALFRQWKHNVAKAPELGDQAAIDHFSFEKGLSRDDSILVRRANLLVFVDYGLWRHPDPSAMDAQIIALAKGILEGHSR